MAESSEDNKQKKGTFTEEDVCFLLQRYPAATILSVLREAAQSPEVKFDWNAALSKLSGTTGIKTPRELQLLWRHLAYRQPLADDNLNLSPQPLDDDSDLEYEVEVFPPVSVEAATEASNSVKVLAYGSANESGIPYSTNVEGDMPNGHVKSAVEKPNSASLLPNSNRPPSVSGQVEGLDANGLANTSRKKRKWSEEEDLKLLSGISKWGEGNWAAMLKEVGNWGRTAGQLAQRWSNMRRKQGNLNGGVAGSIGPQLSEAQLATRRALNMALKDNLIAVGNGAAGSTNNPTKPTTSNGEPPSSSNNVPSQKQVAQATNTSVKPAPVSSLSKPRPSPKKAPPKPPSVSDPIQRAAVAAGARIAGTSAAAALHKQVVTSMFPNVHFIRTGLTATAASTSLATGGQQAKGSAGKPSGASPAFSHLPRANSMPAVASERSNVSLSSSANVKQEEKTSAEVNVGGRLRKTIVGVQENNASLRKPSKALPETAAAAAAESHLPASKGIALNEGKDETSKKVIVNPVPMDVCENFSAAQQNCIQNANGRPELMAEFGG